MTALAQIRRSDRYGTTDSVLPPLLQFPAAASTTVFEGAIAATNASGYAVPASANSALKIWGRCEKTADNSAGLAAAIPVRVRPGSYYYATTGTAPTIADVGKMLYAADDQTLSLSDGAGTYPAAGIMLDLRVDGQVACALGQPSLYVANPEVLSGLTAFRARAVLTSVASYVVGTDGALTASANGAIGAQDGITLAVGDQVLLGADKAASAADEGPYVVSAVGASSPAAKFKLVRPDWWAHGSTILDGAVIQVASEGTVWKGSSWKAFATSGAKTVGTDAPNFWPKTINGQATIGGGGTVSVSTNTWVRKSAITQGLGACNTTASSHVFNATFTQGIGGTGALAFAGTATEVIAYTFDNW